MMEWEGIGIKDADDVRMCLASGATTAELIAMYGERIAPLIADIYGCHVPDLPELPRPKYGPDIPDLPIKNWRER